MTRKEEIENAATAYVEKWYREHYIHTEDFPTDVAISKGDFIAGAEWQYNEFEKNRLIACDNLTEAEAEREMAFIDLFIEENNRMPTYSDTIEVTRKQVIETACKWLTLNVGMLLKVLNVEYSTNETDIKDFIDDFRKAMEE